MTLLEDILSIEERKKKMKSIRRFHPHDIVIHRYNIWDHQNTSLPVWKAAYPILKNFSLFSDIDYEKVKLMFILHDDLETVKCIDESTHEKEKIDKSFGKLISQTQVNLLYNDALDWFGDERALEYFNLVNECNEKNTIESQLVSYFDKYIGKFEAIHNALAGSPDFLEIEGGPGIVERYFTHNKQLREKLIQLRPFFESNNKLNFNSELTWELDWRKYSSLVKGIKHDASSLEVPTGISSYDFVMQALLKHGGDEARQMLISTRF